MLRRRRPEEEEERKEATPEEKTPPPAAPAKVLINLLPAYVVQRRKTIALAFLFGIIIFAEAVGLMSVYTLKSNQLSRLKSEYTQVKQEADEVRRIEGEAKRIKAKIPPLRNDTEFCKSLVLFNDKWAKALREVARYIAEEFVWVTDMKVSSDGITMTVAFKTKDELKFVEHKTEFLENLRRCPVIDEPVIQGGQTRLAVFGEGRQAGGMAPGPMGGMAMGGMGYMGPPPGMMEGAMGPMGMGRTTTTPKGAKFTLQLFLPFLSSIEVPKRKGKAPKTAPTAPGVPGMPGRMEGPGGLGPTMGPGGPGAAPGPGAGPKEEGGGLGGLGRRLGGGE